MTASAQRNPVLDQAKGIAIILVVTGHLMSGETGLEKWIYSFHLPLFLVVNGCLQFLRPSRQTVGQYAWKETKVLLYPFVVFSILKSVINFFVESDPEEFIDPISRLFLFSGDGALWYLPAFFLSALLFFVLHRSGLLKLEGLLCLTTLLCSGVIATNDPYQPDSLMFYVNLINRTLVLCVFTGIGWWLEQRKILSSPLARTGWLLIAAGLVLGMMNSQPDIHYSRLGNPILFYGSATATCTGILMVLKTLNLKMKWLCWLGRNSLLIYLTHTTFHYTGIARSIMEMWTTQSWVITAGAVILVMLAEIPTVRLLQGPLRMLVQYPFQRKKANP